MIRLVIVGVLALVTIGVIRLSSGATSPVPASAVAAPAQDQLYVVRGGIPAPLDAKTKLDIAEGLTAAIAVAPVTAGRPARVVTIDLANGAGPVDGATVTLRAHMRYMEHSDLDARAVASSGGSYVAVLPFSMSGEWELVVTCDAGKTSGSVVLDFVNGN